MNANCVLAVACSLLATAASPAQPSDPDNQERLQQLLDRVPLPTSYYIESDLIAMGGLQDDQVTSRFRTWIGSNWIVSFQSMPQPGIGDVPKDYTYATTDETWRYHLDRQMAERNEVFSQRSRTGGESLTSISYIVRVLRRGEAKVFEIADHAEDGTVTVSLAQPALYLWAILTFDTATGFLTQVQAYDQSGKNLQTNDHFGDWRFLSDESAIPFVLTAERYLPEEKVEWRSVVTKAELIDDTPPARVPIASNFTIIDQIEGVTKRADGKVIGPIEKGTPNSNVTAGRPPGGLGLSSRTVMLIGVGLILLAGIIFGIRRWKGA
ncbi:MAG: hypothetical protein DYG94_04050 [Leptolyngbya sp. PLA3]|nr:MAG: hypothetical protein EDM82_07850 [Cyanobacteria bacterium CYA]MCE7967903.1 hypothetical protein [Leptolyngbya sp. PL-A3]